TRNGFIAFAMIPLKELGEALGCEELAAFSQHEAFAKRDEIKNLLTGFLGQQDTAHWLLKLQAKDLWASDVLNWQQMSKHEGYRCLGMEQVVELGSGRQITTTRCPIRLN